jgi:hypothetical protein
LNRAQLNLSYAYSSLDKHWDEGRINDTFPLPHDNIEEEKLEVLPIVRYCYFEVKMVGDTGFEPVASAM